MRSGAEPEISAVLTGSGAGIGERPRNQLVAEV